MVYKYFHLTHLKEFCYSTLVYRPTDFGLLIQEGPGTKLHSRSLLPPNFPHSPASFPQPPPPTPNTIGTALIKIYKAIPTYFYVNSQSSDRPKIFEFCIKKESKQLLMYVKNMLIYKLNFFYGPSKSYILYATCPRA